MNRRSIVRKVMYIVFIGILLVPLSYFSQPATVAVGNQPANVGGRLAQLREKHQISQSSLGEIDPAGETIKLATLGLRGVAANLLWEKANNAKMKEDWDGLRAALDQLSKLEPHFIIVWRYQAWNVSYNISVEWDDYHDRYFWVKEGVKFLMQGSHYNDREPRLLYDIGWTTGQKMGTADEKAQYRRLFREDDDPVFPNHAGRLRPQNRRDNWLVGQEYFEEAIRLVEDRGASIHRMNPLVFYSEPAMCQIDYAAALEDDGIFEEKAKEGWTDADIYWAKFGAREMPTTVGTTMRLNEEEALQRQAADLVKQLEALSPGLRKKMVEERRAKMSPEERDAIEMPADRRTQEDMAKAYNAMLKLNVPHKELAERVEAPLREKARKMAADAARLQDAADMIHRERDVVNFLYWRTRCKAEMTDAALAARRQIYDANGLYELAQLEEARATYEKGFANWRQVLDQFPGLANDSIGATGIEDAIKGYVKVLEQLDAPFPKDFALKDVMRAMAAREAVSIPPEFLETFKEDDAAKPADADPKSPDKESPDKQSPDKQSPDKQSSDKQSSDN